MIPVPSKGTRITPGITNTTLFLLPITGNLKSDMVKYGFLNSYIKDELKDEYENCVICLFQPPDIVDFDMFVEEEKVNKVSFVDDYDYPGGFSILVYSMGKDYEADIEKIMQGKYSKTSRRYKQLIPEKLGKGNLNINKSATIQHRVFGKDPKLREMLEKEYDIEIPEDIDLWELFDKENETLKWKT